MSRHQILEHCAGKLTHTTLTSLSFNTIKPEYYHKNRCLINELSVSNIEQPCLNYTVINAQEPNGLETQYTALRLIKNLYGNSYR